MAGKRGAGQKAGSTARCPHQRRSAQGVRAFTRDAAADGRPPLRERVAVDGVRAVASQRCRFWLRADHRTRRQRGERSGDDVASEPGRVVGAASEKGQSTTRRRSGGRIRKRIPALRPGKEIPQRVSGVGVAVCFSIVTNLARPAQWVRRRTAAVAPPSCGRKRLAGCGEEGSAGIRHFKTGDVSYAAAFVCDAFVGERVRYSNCPGVVRSQGRKHDDDLHARVESTGAWGAKSDGYELRERK